MEGLGVLDDDMMVSLARPESGVKWGRSSWWEAWA